VDALAAYLLASDTLHVDDTPVPVLAPGTGKTKTGRLWTHHASAVHKLPVLFVVMNNSMWGAVRRATLGMYPHGEAARSNKPPH
jgi:TPP-dependent pyruvate/acetoin dehydrogenase alpha subunit